MIVLVDLILIFMEILLILDGRINSLKNLSDADSLTVINLKHPL